MASYPLALYRTGLRKAAPVGFLQSPWLSSRFLTRNPAPVRRGLASYTGTADAACACKERWRALFAYGNNDIRIRRLATIPPDLSIEEEKLPDPRNPHENPLATIGDDELSEDKRYWRKKQAETMEKVYVREVQDDGSAYAVGRRKASIAQVWIRDGTGSVVVNDRNWVKYFRRIDLRDQILRPMFLLGVAGQFDVKIKVLGGGNMGQAEAIRHGLARALQKWNPEWRATLKRDGLLTRDSRVVESKKYGRKKARKAFQWVKR